MKKTLLALLLVASASTGRAETFVPEIDLREMKAAVAPLNDVVMDEIRRPDAYLRSCRANAKVRRINGQLVLTIIDSDDCSNMTINGQTFKMNRNLFNERGMSVVIREHAGQNRIVATIHSNSRRHLDNVIIHSYVQPRVRANVRLSTMGDTFERLPNCGGSVRLHKVNGQVNLVFRNVMNCSNFDIVAANGQRIDYPNQKLRIERDGDHRPDRGGSFTLPRSIMDHGFNGVLTILRSNSGQTSDRIHVQFYRW